ncbi:FadR/GntR family transcriptional regulator [Roseimicrobium gellanilyticum]|nr:FadR/GntR family transcriptional regulator [Roseimicrobium gellanilyticum]
MKKLKPVEYQPLSRQVLRSLLENISARGLGPEDKLPTERELANDLGVGRNTVREALKSLEMIGALERRPKRGSVIQAVDLSLLGEVTQALWLRTDEDASEMYEARRTIELGVLRLAAANATEEDFLRMEEANEQMERDHKQGFAPTEADAAFHQALLGASHNRFLIQFGRLLEEFFRNVRQRYRHDAAVARRTLDEHRQIVTALRRGRVAQAERLMEAHLDPHRQPPTPGAKSKKATTAGAASGKARRKRAATNR